MKSGDGTIAYYYRYKDGQTYDYSDYDKEGNLVKRYQRNLNELSMSPHTWYTSEPLSAVITISGDGAITIEGMESSWAYGIIPEGGISGTEPYISSYRKQL